MSENDELLNNNHSSEAVGASDKPSDTASKTDSNETSFHSSSPQFAPDVKLKPCPYCRVMIPRDARICPNCKMKIKKKWKQLLKVLLILILLAAIIFGCLYFWNDIEATISNGIISRQDAQTDIEQATEAEVAALLGDDYETLMETAETDPTESEPSSVESEPIDETSVEETSGDETAEAETSSENSESETTENVTDSETPSEETTETETSSEVSESETSETAADSETPSEETTEAETNSESSEDTEAVQTLAAVSEEEEAYKALCKVPVYKAFLRHPEAYFDTYITTVLTIEDTVDGGLFDKNIYFLCHDESGNRYILCDERISDTTKLFAEDEITVYGQFYATCTLPASVSTRCEEVPAIRMVYADLMNEESPVYD